MFKRFGAGFAVGYVFGARAGQKRYEQIADLAQQLLDTPLGSRVADRSRELFSAENGQRLLQQLRERGRHLDPSPSAGGEQQNRVGGERGRGQEDYGDGDYGGEGSYDGPDDEDYDRDRRPVRASSDDEYYDDYEEEYDDSDGIEDADRRDTGTGRARPVR